MRLRFYNRWYANKPNTSTVAEAESFEHIDSEGERIWHAEWKKKNPDHELTSKMAREIALRRPYATYLADALSTNFPAHHPEDVDKILSQIAQLERGDIGEAIRDLNKPLHVRVSLSNMALSVNALNGLYGHVALHNIKRHYKAGASLLKCLRA